MEFNLKKILKALLFSTSEPLSIKDVQAVVTRFHDEADRWRKEAAQKEDLLVEDGGQGLMMELIEQVPTLLTATQIRDAMDEIARDLEEANEVIRLVRGPRGYQVTSAPEYADWVRLLRGQPRPQRLSRAAMETLAITAYRQPVTRPEMESIRGVSVDSAVNRLLENDLIAVVGRADLPGRPLQYGTTEKFLEFIGVKNLDELPASDVLSHREVSEYLQQSSDNEPIGDEEMGLPAENSETDSEPELSVATADPEPQDGKSDE